MILLRQKIVTFATLYQPKLTTILPGIPPFDSFSCLNVNGIKEYAEIAKTFRRMCTKLVKDQNVFLKVFLPSCAALVTYLKDYYETCNVNWYNISRFDLPTENIKEQL